MEIKVVPTAERAANNWNWFRYQLGKYYDENESGCIVRICYECYIDHLIGWSLWDKIMVQKDVDFRMSCSLCHDVGWILEAKTRAGYTTLEILPCLIPDCPASGQPVTLLSCELLEMDRVVGHPKYGVIMSIFKGTPIKKQFRIKRS